MKPETIDSAVARRRKLTAIRNRRLRERKKTGAAIVTIALTADDLRRYAQRGLIDPQRGSQHLIRKALAEMETL